MLVAIVTDNQTVPVELIYFLLGAGHESDLYQRGKPEDDARAVIGDFFVADSHAPGLASIEWISKLPAEKSAVVLRILNGQLRRALAEKNYSTVLQYPAQIRELANALRGAAPILRSEQARLLQSRFGLGDVEFDVMSRKLKSPRFTLTLTTSEAKVLACLLQSFGVPVARRQLELASGNVSSGASTRKIDVMISSLRVKLKKVGSPSQIAAIRNQGYSIDGDWKSL